MTVSSRYGVVLMPIARGYGGLPRIRACWDRALPGTDRLRGHACHADLVAEGCRDGKTRLLSRDNGVFRLEMKAMKPVQPVQPWWVVVFFVP